MLKWLCYAGLIICIIQCCFGQLVLDDIAEDVEEHPASSEKQRQASDPYTSMLQWGVDNMDRDSVAEQAKAIREVHVSL